MEGSPNRSGLRFTPAQVEQLQKDLFKMKHFGSSLRNIFFSIERGHRMVFEQRKVVQTIIEQRKVVYNNMKVPHLPFSFG